ncbi:MAG: archaetidylserine decarboxylase [Myxococcota bacterium]
MKKILPYILRYLPRRSISHLIGNISEFGNEQFQKRLINWFIKRHNVNIEEIQYPVEHYRTLKEFFIRELKPDARDISNSEMVSPVDGVMTECGAISDRCLKCKGELLSINELINDDEFVSSLTDGYYTIHYLSPKDYHWIHSPVDGEIYKIVRLKGDLYPVFDEMVCRKRDILVINERLNFFIRNDKFKVCLSAIAAMGVGNIIPSNNILLHDSLDGRVQNPIKIKKGEKLAVFALGSTVVLVFDKLRPNPSLKLKYLKLGTSLI